MSIYSAFYDAVRQKQDMLNTSDRVATIKDFKVSLKMNYLIYGTVVFTDAQIFDGSVFHAMLLEKDKFYWNEFVGFLRESVDGSIKIRHGEGSFAERLQSCLTDPTFGLSSLELYDKETIVDVNKTRQYAVTERMLTASSDNPFYKNLSIIKKEFMSKRLRDKEIYSSWVNEKNGRGLLSLFIDKPQYQDSFKNQMNQYRDYDKLRPALEIIDEQFDTKTGKIPRRSEWIYHLYNVIDNPKNEKETRNAANRLLLSLNDCYVALCAHQHRCYFVSLQSPFSFSNPQQVLPDEEDRFDPDSRHVFISDEVWEAMRDEPYHDFLEKMRQERFRKKRQEWLDSLYRDGRDFNPKLLHYLVGQLYVDYAKGVTTLSFTDYQKEQALQSARDIAELSPASKCIKPIDFAVGKHKGFMFNKNIKRTERDITDKILTEYDNII